MLSGACRGPACSWAATSLETSRRGPRHPRSTGSTRPSRRSAHQTCRPTGARRLQPIPEAGNRLSAILADRRRLRVPAMPELGQDVLARFPVLVEDKQAFLAEARQRRVEVAEWYATPVHPVPVDKAVAYNYRAGSCPEAEERGKELVSLPLGRRVTRTYMDRLCALIDVFEVAPPDQSDGEPPRVRIEEVGVRLSDTDARALARLHVNAIPDGFLGSLGEGFLMQVYDAVAGSDQAFIYVARDQSDGIIGFICGSLDTSRVLRCIRSRQAACAAPGARLSGCRHDRRPQDARDCALSRSSGRHGHAHTRDHELLRGRVVAFGRRRPPPVRTPRGPVPHVGHRALLDRDRR